MSMGDAAMQEESQGEKDIFSLGNDIRADYETRFVPLEMALVQELSSVQDKKPQSRGRSAASVRQNFDKTYDDIAHSNTARGADPSSGSAVMGLGDASVQEARTQTGATTASDQIVDDAYYSGQRQITRMGQNLRSDSVGLQTLSSGLSSNLENIKASNDAYNKAAAYGAVGTVAGVAGRTSLEEGWFDDDKEAES